MFTIQANLVSSDIVSDGETMKFLILNFERHGTFNCPEDLKPDVFNIFRVA